MRKADLTRLIDLGRVDRAPGEPHRDRTCSVFLDGPERHPDEKLSLIATAIKEWAEHASPKVEVTGRTERFGIARKCGYSSSGPGRIRENHEGVRPFFENSTAYR